MHWSQKCIHLLFSCTTEESEQKKIQDDSIRIEVEERNYSKSDSI